MRHLTALQCGSAIVSSVRCNSCGSEKPGKFRGEVAIHTLALKNIADVVWVFPELVICLSCGAAQFVVEEAELRKLAKRDTDDPKTAAGGPP